MPQEQPSRGIPFHDLHHIGDHELWLTVQEKVDVIRHDLHRQDLKGILLSDLFEHRLYILIDTVPKNLFSILGTPHNMIL